MPLAPVRLDRSDGSGIDYTCTSTSMTAKETPSGMERTVTTNERGHLLSEAVMLNHGGSIQTGGTT